MSKKCKIIISLILLFIVGLSIIIFLKIRNNYILKIKNAFIKTINASSTTFEIEYFGNEDKLSIEGNAEYSLKELKFLANAICNEEKIFLDVSKEKSTIYYYFKLFNKWIDADITKISSEILEKISALGKNNITESFPVQDILRTANISEIVEITDYPNKLTKTFLLNFINNNFLDETLKFDEKKENDLIIYSVKPDIYKLLKEFINTSDLSENLKNNLNSDLDENKEQLDSIDLILTISITKDGFIQNFIYSKQENEIIQKLNLKLNNINNAQVELKNVSQ